MSQWIKIPDGQLFDPRTANKGVDGYVNIARLAVVYVTSESDGSWSICAYGDGGVAGLILKGGFASQAAAQTALDNFMTLSLGGSI